jgi:hypothetical protein
MRLREHETATRQPTRLKLLEIMAMSLSGPATRLFSGEQVMIGALPRQSGARHKAVSLVPGLGSFRRNLFPILIWRELHKIFPGLVDKGGAGSLAAQN